MANYSSIYGDHLRGVCSSKEQIEWVKNWAESNERINLDIVVLAQKLRSFMAYAEYLETKLIAKGEIVQKRI